MRARVLHRGINHEDFENQPEDEAQPRIIYGDATNGFWLECRITDPPSSAGRDVDVFVPPEMLPELMKEIRGMLIRQRSKPLPAPEPSREAKP